MTDLSPATMPLSLAGQTLCTGLVMLPGGQAGLPERIPSAELRTTARPPRRCPVSNAPLVGGKTQALINYHAVGWLCEG